MAESIGREWPTMLIAREKAIRLANECVINAVNNWAAESEQNDYSAAQVIRDLSEMLTLAKTKRGAAAELRRCCDLDISLEQVVLSLKDLPEIDEHLCDIISVDLPGGSMMSRMVQ